MSIYAFGSRLGHYFEKKLNPEMLEYLTGGVKTSDDKQNSIEKDISISKKV